MALIDDLAIEESATPSTSCGIAAWLATLDEPNRDAWLAAYDRGVSMAVLYRVAVKNGLTRSLSLVRAHFRTECGCL